MKREIFKKFNIPNKPGVYSFKKNGRILYIGKATSLRDRTRSYMSKGLFDMRGPIVEKMVAEADKIDWIVTDSVLEALILEANLIKKHQPYYNTKEKSDKSFNYVVITKEKLPKVVILRGKNVKHRVFNKIYGPYPNSSQLREAMKIVRRIFPFLDDKSKNYLEFYQQINLAPDINDQEMYLQNIKNIKLFFAGKKKKVLQNLKKQMLAYAKERKFEKASEVKRQIFALNHINDVALIKNDNVTSSNFRIEAYDIAHMGGKNMVGVLTVVENGMASKSEYKKFKIRTQSGTNDTGALAEVLSRRLLHREWQYPNLVVVDGSTAQINTAKYALMKERAEIPVVAVVKDERHKPREIIGDTEYGLKYKKEILLANSEAHRFAISYHKNMRAKNFLR